MFRRASNYSPCFTFFPASSFVICTGAVTDFSRAVLFFLMVTGQRAEWRKEQERHRRAVVERIDAVLARVSSLMRARGSHASSSTAYPSRPRPLLLCQACSPERTPVSVAQGPRTPERTRAHIRTRRHGRAHTFTGVATVRARPCHQFGLQYSCCPCQRWRRALPGSATATTSPSGSPSAATSGTAPRACPHLSICLSVCLVCVCVCMHSRTAPAQL